MRVHWQLNLIGMVVVAAIAYGLFSLMSRNGYSQTTSILAAVGFSVVIYPFIVALSTKGHF